MIYKVALQDMSLEISVTADDFDVDAESDTVLFFNRGEYDPVAEETTDTSVACFHLSKILWVMGYTNAEDSVT